MGFTILNFPKNKQQNEHHRHNHTKHQPHPIQNIRQIQHHQRTHHSHPTSVRPHAKNLNPTRTITNSPPRQHHLTNHNPRTRQPDAPRQHTPGIPPHHPAPHNHIIQTTTPHHQTIIRRTVRLHNIPINQQKHPSQTLSNKKHPPTPPTNQKPSTNNKNNLHTK